MINDQVINFWSEHDWTIDVQAASAQIFVGTHTGPSTTHDECKHATIPPCPKSTFHRWLKKERGNNEKPKP
jgi:hypothetical protein